MCYSDVSQTSGILEWYPSVTHTGETLPTGGSRNCPACLCVKCDVSMVRTVSGLPQVRFPSVLCHSNKPLPKDLPSSIC